MVFAEKDPSRISPEFDNPTPDTLILPPSPSFDEQSKSQDQSEDPAYREAQLTTWYPVVNELLYNEQYWITPPAGVTEYQRLIAQQYLGKIFVTKDTFQANRQSKHSLNGVLRHWRILYGYPPGIQLNGYRNLAFLPKSQTIDFLWFVHHRVNRPNSMLPYTISPENLEAFQLRNGELKPLRIPRSVPMYHRAANLTKSSSPDSDRSTPNAKPSRKNTTTSTSGEDQIPTQIADTHDMIRLFMHQASQTDLLTAEQEVELAKMIERGNLATEKLTTSSLTPEEMSYFQQHIEDGKQARKALAAANTLLVISIAKRYIDQGLPLQDLIQEGTIGLMKAIDKFDYRLGNKFSTYATWWIRQAISRSLDNTARNIRLPVHTSEKLRLINRIISDLTHELGREPNAEEIAEAAEMNVQKYTRFRQQTEEVLSLDQQVNTEPDSDTLGELQRSTDASPTAIVHANLLADEIDQALQRIPAKEQRILRLRFGFVDGTAYTLEQIGTILGITRERVRQLERQAINRLQISSMSVSLRNYLHPETDE